MKKKVLITFVGSNDSNKKSDGAILTIFKDKSRKFDEVILLWNPSEFGNFFEIAKYVKSEITKRKYCNNVTISSFECEDVTDHNEIYPKLLNFCNSIDKNKIYIAAIASGTPSMQACWILLAESGDFPIKLIRSDDPKFGKPFVREVKLGTSLPRIMRLERENSKLKRSLLKDVRISITKAELKIGTDAVNLSPIEFSYYRYFLDRSLQGKDYLRIDVDIVPDEFYNFVLKSHRESYPQADSNRSFSQRNKAISSATFRANVSKLNRKIKSALNDSPVSKYYCVEGTGQKFRKLYGINVPGEKIKIIK